MVILYLYIISAIISFLILIYDLIKYYIKKESKGLNFNFLIDFLKLNNKKKIIFIIIYTISIPFIPIFYMIVFLNTVFLFFKVIKSINKKKEIKLEENSWNIITKKIEYSNTFTYLNYIIKCIIFQIKKISFFRLYYIFKKNKKLNIRTVEQIGFKYAFMIPLNYAKHIINILNKEKNKINNKKIFRIKIKMIFKNVLIRICEFVEDDSFLGYNMYIIYIDNFNISVSEDKFK